MTRTDSAARFFETRKAVWGSWRQQRDIVEMHQDNRSAAMVVVDAQAMRRWADVRAKDAAFADVVAQARRQAAVDMQANRPRAV